MTIHLLRDLDRIKKEILLMGGQVEEAFRKAHRALIDRDEDLAAEVIEGDHEIDRQELLISEECLKILALHQPVAADLRFVISVMMVNNDLERVGDLAVNLSERALDLSRAQPVTIPETLTSMAGTVSEMLKQSLDSMVNQDVEEARRVCDMDDEVDDLHEGMFQHVRSSLEQEGADPMALLGLLSASRSLERIADHATNVAEDVVFMVEGEVIKHPGMQVKKKV